MKKSAEAAAENGEILGEPYTPPGRTAVFDVPAYDDIADLHELFKRFANTAAGVSEAGLGGLVDKTADFTVTTNDLGKTYVCNSADLLNVTVGAAADFQEGARFNIVQAGSGKVQVKGSDVIGASRTTGQYEGLTAVVHGGKWWCLPFGSSSGGGGGGPIQIVDTAADLTINASHMGALVACDTSAKAITVTLPVDDGTIPVGAAIVVSNVGAGASKAKVVGASGVTVQDRAAASVGRYQSISLVKRSANVWLINAGGGNSGGSVPSAPQNVAAFGNPGGIVVTWQAPEDDGGHTITSYLIDHGDTPETLTSQKVVSGDALTVNIEGLAAGKTHYARVKAVNSLGPSDPSVVVSSTPTNDFNIASGGTESTYTKDGRAYRVHVFDKADTLKITKAVNAFQILVVGGGGRGGSGIGNGGGGGGGGAGGVISTSGVIPVGDYAVSIGAGSATTTPGGNSSIGQLYTALGGGSAVDNAAGGAGGSGAGGGGRSAAGGKGTAGQGHDGGNASADAYWGSGNGGGAGGFDGIETLITGTSMWVGGGGAGGPALCDTCGGFGGKGGGGSAWGRNSQFAPGTDRDGKAPSHNGRPNTGGGGGGGAGNNGPTSGGGSGGSGLVVVAYEIAPYNAATGGAESDYYDSKTGTHYKVHKFTANDVFKVTNATRPFRIFVQGGGAGGGYGRGGGRGAANDAEFTLLAQNYSITVGAAVSGGYDEITNRDAPGNNGNRSAVEGVVSSPGGVSRGDYYAAGVTTDITGSAVTYGGAGGNDVINEDRNEGGFPGGGQGGTRGTDATVTGGGGGGGQWHSGGGARGEVIIRYEIAK